jgi:hypothetical protein
MRPTAATKPEKRACRGRDHQTWEKDLRILMLAPSTALRGGVIDFVRMVCANLPAHEIRTTQVGNDNSNWPLPFRVFRDAWSLIWAIARLRPDVIHLNPSFDRAMLRDGFYLMVARLVHRGPIVFFIHGWDLNWERRIQHSPVLKGLLRLVAGRADRIFVLAR